MSEYQGPDRRQPNGQLQEMAEAAAEHASEKTMEKTFLMLGADIASPTGVQSLQKDWSYNHKRRIAYEATQGVVKRAALGTIVVGALGGGWMLIKDHLEDLLK